MKLLKLRFNEVQVNQRQEIILFFQIMQQRCSCNAELERNMTPQLNNLVSSKKVCFYIVMYWLTKAIRQK